MDKYKTRDKCNVWLRNLFFFTAKQMDHFDFNSWPVENPTGPRSLVRFPTGWKPRRRLLTSFSCLVLCFAVLLTKPHDWIVEIVFWFGPTNSLLIHSILANGFIRIYFVSYSIDFKPSFLCSPAFSLSYTYRARDKEWKKQWNFATKKATSGVYLRQISLGISFRNCRSTMNRWARHEFRSPELDAKNTESILIHFCCISGSRLDHAGFHPQLTSWEIRTKGNRLRSSIDLNCTTK